ncbi:MAG: DUF805 domain-containing protein [Ruminococcus sp.]|nr:DUF805 domain-containing protein [Ruminococcus sp.]
MRCIGCDNMIPDGVKFCPICGAKQPAAAAPPPPPPPAQYPQYPQNQQYGQYNQYQQNHGAPPAKESPCYVGFGEAIGLYFKNYVNFKGRSTRSEYWFAFLFTSLIYIVFGIASIIFPAAIYLPTMVFFVPSMAVKFRRFHDTGRKGTLVVLLHVTSALYFILGTIAIFCLIFAMFGAFDDLGEPTMWISLGVMSFMGYIPMIIGIICMVICCQPSVPEANEYGRAPY